jgi:hypothetical protein
VFVQCGTWVQVPMLRYFGLGTLKRKSWFD